MKYRPEIDGLRTIAVLSVIIYHAEFTIDSTPLLTGGFLGVDVFFVISGYLITSLIIKEIQETKKFSIAGFYERRARRLIPALLMVALVSLPFAWLLLYPTQLIDFSKSLIASLFFASNFYWHETLQEYGTESALLKPFLHTWSLAVEEQFYIIFPWLLLAIYQWRKKHVFSVLAVSFVASLILAEWLTRDQPSLSFYMLPSRFWELLAGGILANYMRQNTAAGHSVVFRRTMPAVGLSLIIYSVLFTSYQSNHPGLVTLAPVLGTVLIIWFANEDDVVTRILSSKAFVAIGLISYSLYLWHYPIFAFGRINNFDAQLADKLFWIVLTFVLAISSYYLVENPLRQKSIVSRRVFFRIVLIASLAVLGFSATTIHQSGLKDRFPHLVKIYGKNEFDNTILKRATWDILNGLAASHGMGRSKAKRPSDFEAQKLWFSKDTTTDKILVTGDSHSKDLFNALHQNQQRFTTAEFARFGMSNAVLTEQIDILLQSPNFLASDMIVISFRYTDETVKNIPKFVEVLKSHSKRVLLVVNTVEFELIDGRPVFDWYAESLQNAFSAADLNRLYFKNISREKDKINARLVKIAQQSNIEHLNRFDFICSHEHQTCEGLTDNGYKIFFDYGHFSIQGAKYFGKRIHSSNWLRLD